MSLREIRKSRNLTQKQLAVLFYYEGEQYMIPFRAHFTEKYLPFLVDAAVMKIEDKIEDILFERTGTDWW